MSDDRREPDLARIRFRLLGSLEIDTGGQLPHINSHRQRVVLGLLLLEAGRVVSVDRMVDALWGDKPPQTARSQVQITVFALRKLFGKDVILTRSPGYVIKVPPDALDVTEFEHHLALAKGALAGERTQEAVQHFRAGLSLWRGEALEDVESEVVAAAVVRLNEHRISALQTCIDLELRQGQHAELVGELTTLVTDNPLNERFRSQLMLALHREGRTADALEVLRAGREILKSELGLGPGAGLRSIERVILSGDGEDMARAAVEALPPEPSDAPSDSGAVPVPHQLPRTVTDFVERAEAARMRAILSGGDTFGVPVVVLVGAGGTGKTALAVRVAHQMRESFPDGQLFVQLRSDDLHSTSGLLEHLLRSMGWHSESLPADLEARAALYRSLLADRRILVVIDGAVAPSMLSYLLPGMPGCAAIVTSRQRLASLEGARHIHVGPLDAESALRLLEAMIGKGRVAAEKDAAQDLVALCDGVPLALRIVGAKLVGRKHWRIGRMVAALQSEARRLNELDFDGVSVRATLAISYESLDEDSRKLLRRLSLCGSSDFSPGVAAPLLDQEVITAENLLYNLLEWHLIEATSADDQSARFRLHNLVRIYAEEQFRAEESDFDQAASADRLLGWWLSLVTTAHRQLYGGDFGALRGHSRHWSPPGTSAPALGMHPADWFRKERSSLLSAILLASNLDLDEICWELSVTSASLFEAGIYSDDWRNSHMLALDTVWRAGNRRGEVAVLYSLGVLELGIHVPTAAGYFELARRVSEDLSETQGRALALAGLAFVDRLGGRYRAAQGRYEQALEGFNETGDLAAQAHTRKALARIQADRGDYRAAEQSLEGALRICEGLRAPRVTAQVMCELAELRASCGQLTVAEEMFRVVLSGTREAGDIIGQGYALMGIGNARRSSGDLMRSMAILQEAYQLVSNAADRLLHGRVLLALAELHLDLDQADLAQDRVEGALRVLCELAYTGVWHARALAFLGRLLEQAGQPKRAARAWRTAIEFAREADPVLTEELASKAAAAEVVHEKPPRDLFLFKPQLPQLSI